MRKTSEKQMPLMPVEELSTISRVLDLNSIIYDQVMKSLCPKRTKSKTGVKGMSAGG